MWFVSRIGGVINNGIIGGLVEATCFRRTVEAASHVSIVAHVKPGNKTSARRFDSCQPREEVVKYRMEK